MNADETKKYKAKQLRYKKPIVKNLNLDKITEDLWDIQDECENIRWYTDSEDGSDSLLNALDGDEDEAYEFKMAFGDLCAECEQMMSDLNEEWVPECFDIFFVAARAGDSYGGILGYDTYEQDYYGISCMDSFAEDEAKKKLKQMTKDEINKTKRDKCQYCIYSRKITTTVCKSSLNNIICYYIAITHNRRGCRPDECDKFERRKRGR